MLSSSEEWPPFAARPHQRRLRTGGGDGKQVLENKCFLFSNVSLAEGMKNCQKTVIIFSVLCVTGADNVADIVFADRVARSCAKWLVDKDR